MTVENRSKQILASALEGTVVERAKSDRDCDFWIRTRDGHRVAIEAKWAGEGWPQDVRQATADVCKRWPASLVVLAHRFSPGAIEWLRERGANWADEAGQARIFGPDGLIVIREPDLTKQAARAPHVFGWSRSALTIGELILAREDQTLQVATLASASGWSVPQASKVLRAFDSQGWTTKHGSSRGRQARRELIDPDGMLSSWSGAVADQPRRTRTAHRAVRDVMGLLRGELAPAMRGMRWAVSGWAGLELAAPFATATPSLHIYVADKDFAGRLTTAIEKAGLREVEQGGRVTFWAADLRMLELASSIKDLPVVSAPRLYADLSTFAARGQDAADHVRQELIDPLHLGGRIVTADRG